MYLGDLMTAAGYTVGEDVKNIEITGICSDSRRVRQGELFVATAGLSFDGFVYIGEAMARGAAFAVAERKAPGVPQLTVENAREALSRLLDAWYGHPTRDVCLVGVTGTNGKTSTANMIAEILRAAGHKTGVIGTMGAFFEGEKLPTVKEDTLSNMTTPDPEELYRLLHEMKARGATHVVMEVSSHALAQGRVAPLRFARAVFTNLSAEHLDFHGDMVTYFAEKQKLFGAAETGVISLFGAYGQLLADTLSIPFYTVGKNTVRRVLCQDVSGVSFSLFFEGALLDFSLPVPGDFSVENGALAAMTALSLGVTPEVVKGALSSFGGVSGRMERLTVNTGGRYVFLDYAHTPDALEKLLLSVRRFKGSDQRLFLLFGCGGNRDRDKRRKMGRIATRLADVTVITSDNCRDEHPDDIIADILRGVDKEKPYRVIPDRRQAIEYTLGAARAGDIVLLTGKGHEEYEIRGRERLPFSEREIVRAYFEGQAGSEV